MHRLLYDICQVLLHLLFRVALNDLDTVRYQSYLQLLALLPSFELIYLHA